jgi:hypothetical protein
MADLKLTPIQNGMPLGGDVIGTNFDLVTEAINANATTGSNDWPTDGMTLVNGAQLAAGAWMGYRVLQLGTDWQLVQISAALTNVTKSDVPLITLPAGLTGKQSLNFTAPATGSQVLRWQLNKEQLSLTGGVKPNSASDWVSVYLMIPVYTGAK